MLPAEFLILDGELGLMDLQLVEQPLELSLSTFDHPGRRPLESHFCPLAELLQSSRVMRCVLSHTAFLPSPPDMSSPRQTGYYVLQLAPPGAALVGQMGSHGDEAAQLQRFQASRRRSNAHNMDQRCRRRRGA